MKIRDILSDFKFVETDDNEFVRDIWTVRLEDNNFELFADPEIDLRYYFGCVGNLETYLKAINK